MTGRGAEDPIVTGRDAEDPVVTGSKLISLAEAAALVGDGCRLGIGGVLTRRKPIALLAAVAERVASGTGGGPVGLEIVSFLAGLDVDLLVAAGVAAEVRSGYVGFEQLGFAPAFSLAVEGGALRAHEYSEMLFTAGLRAAGAGLPFMPTRGATGSALLGELGLQTVRCPYSGEDVTAVPALAPDVTVIHADAADAQGNVALPAVRDFLFDSDALLARASSSVIVSAERIVETAELRGQGALLFSYEVDAVVHAPGGAWPTALPGSYAADTARIARYLKDAGTDPAAAARALIDDVRSRR